MTEFPIDPDTREGRACLAAKIMKKLLRKKAVGSNTFQIATVKNWFPSHQQGLVEEVLREMARTPSVPVRRYGGGHRDSVHITDYARAYSFADAHGADLQWIEKPASSPS